jgi:hypothetical protein
MSLIPCPACGKLVSRQAPTCPQCGHPIAGSPSAPPPQTIVVEQPTSGGGGGAGCLLFLVVLAVAAFVLFQTDLGKQLLDVGRKVTDSQRILGKWKGKGTLDTIEFFSNGDVRIYALLATHKGTWKIMPGQRLTMETEGLLWGTNKMEWKYEISGKTLTLKSTNGNISLQYEKE